MDNRRIVEFGLIAALIAVARIVEFGLIAALIAVAIICATNILVYAT